MKIKTLFSLLIAFNLVLTASAQAAPPNSISSVINAYRFYKDIDRTAVQVPTVVEVPFADEFIERFDFAVLDKKTNTFEPHFFKQETLINEIPVSISASPSIGGANRLNDKDSRTYADFPLPDNAQGHAQITVNGAGSITSSALTILLDTNVALPNYLEIRALVNGQSRIVVANRRMDQPTILFPQTTSNRWIITFTFGQPLRISELQLHQDNAAKTNTRAVRFLTQPSHSYRIYFDSDRPAAAPVGEAGNLLSAKDVFIIPFVASQNNPDYISADVDNDGVPDIRDNCVSVANSDQQDANNNDRGDACDDFDQDGLINAKDNCPDNPNRNQQDTDSDGRGDVCDQEESRITERYALIPWAGIGFAGLVLIVLFALTARKKT